MTSQVVRFALILVVFVTVVTFAAGVIFAAPITSGMGPGGIGTVDGASSLKLWLQPETLTLGSVSSWTDSSGAGHNATEGTANLQPTAIAGGPNGNRTAVFSPSGTPDRLSIADHADFNVINLTTFSVFANTTASNGTYAGLITKHTDNTWGPGWGVNKGPSKSAQFWDHLTSNSESYAADPDGQYQIVASIRSTEGSNFRRRLALNSFGTAGSANAVSPTFTADPVRIGHDVAGINSPSYFLDGGIAETIFFNQTLDGAEQLIVENYLSAKFNIGSTTSGANITLGTNDRYAGDLDTNGNYDRNVFGIGRVVTGIQSTLTTGAAGFGVEVDSATLGDNEWVFAGHDGTTNSLINLVPSIDAGDRVVTQRWDQVWYVDVTGSLEATLSFDWSDAGLTMPTLESGETFQLIYSDEDPFDFTLVDATAIISGDTISFELTSGQLLDGYYTLAIASVPEPSTALMVGLGLAALVTTRRRRKA